MSGNDGFIASVKKNSVIHVLLAILFMTSGLIVNALQALTMILWFSGKKDLYRTLNIRLAYLHWALIPFLLEWWADVKVNFYTTPEDANKFNKESAVVVMNHKYDIDWAIGWNAKCMAKSALSYVPVIGWAWRFCEYIFVTRDLERDVKTILKALKNLAQFKHYYWVRLSPKMMLVKLFRPIKVCLRMPCIGACLKIMAGLFYLWLYNVTEILGCHKLAVNVSSLYDMLIFCEGTRFTEEKHKLSMEFAANKGLKPLKHHLLPRTGGFRMVVKGVRDSAAALYDATIYVKGNRSPTLIDLLCGKSCEVDFLCIRTPVEKIPADDKECSDFVYDLYERKDKYFDFCRNNDRFPVNSEDAVPDLKGYELTEYPRRTECLWIAISWAVLILTPLFYYVYTLVVTGAWVKITVMVLVLSAVSYLFQKIVAQGAVSTSSSSYGMIKKSD